MLMNQVLDSSPVHIPSRDKDAHSLKRSASVASLPTPPHTHHKRSRSRPRSSASSYDSDSATELDDDIGSGYTARIKRAKTRSGSRGHSAHELHDNLTEDESPDHKKRRTLAVLPGHDEEDDDENSFWTGRGGMSRLEKQEKQKEDLKSSERSPSPAMLRYSVKAPVSPPPSRRVPQVQPTRAASVERTLNATPVTPPRKLLLRAPSPLIIDAFKTPTKPKATKIWPKRDSPNNPFLEANSDKVKLRSEWDSSDDEEVVGEVPVREGTPTPAPTYEEKPTITYVFRGQKATFHNPLYGLPSEVIAASKLPIDHPDFEAAESCPPKRLFFGGKRKSREHSREGTSSEGVKRTRLHRSDSDHHVTSEEEQSGSVPEVGKKLLFVDDADREPVQEDSSRKTECEEALQRAREERERREAAAKARLAPQEGLRAGAVITERDEPSRRAMGPARSA